MQGSLHPKAGFVMPSLKNQITLSGWKTLSTSQVKNCHRSSVLVMFRELQSLYPVRLPDHFGPICSADNPHAMSPGCYGNGVAILSCKERNSRSISCIRKNKKSPRGFGWELSLDVLCLLCLFSLAVAVCLPCASILHIYSSILLLFLCSNLTTSCPNRLKWQFASWSFW